MEDNNKLRNNISVIVPIYNVEKYIEELIVSICNQVDQEFELILVNDGSKDDSVKIACRLLDSASRDYILINQKNSGVSAARNKGIEVAKGEWVICIDSDDYLHPLFIKELKKHTINDSVDFVISNYTYDKSAFLSEKEAYETIEGKTDYLAELYLNNKLSILVTTLLLKKKMLDSKGIKYNEKVKYSEDVGYIWKVLIQSNRGIYITKPLYWYRLHENSTMTSSSIDKIMTSVISVAEVEDVLKKNKMNDLIIPRWKLGLLHSSSKLLSYRDFKSYAYKLNYKSDIKSLIYGNDWHAKLAAFSLSKSLPVSYMVLRLF